jgi:hypothetical protein
LVVIHEACEEEANEENKIFEWKDQLKKLFENP